ncbi:hypothetical protein CH379_000935 [Leptospira ellisii]|uniref:Uncharacterized protein n=1 Tax=Leptospira ellisii TaxID=2023197 RepID=A0A2N0B7J0_9LEPT|nr:hypothetical protein [Leptospira ellisii]MDV6234195.1 hypothetical protein [Leptospira ellisii]PJZ92521.1 hypothetical protein CH379_12740 [Leptospira ellisii]PKA03959.1 hypothetical protein CH375_13885 [Leptospira ellisii]
MVQKKKTKSRNPAPKKKRAPAAPSTRKNDIRISEMIDLATEEFLKTIEMMAKLSAGNRTKLKNTVKAAVKNILKD